MKILWIVNMVLPKLAAYLNENKSASGTWLVELTESLSSNDDVELAIACVYGNEFKKAEIDNITYYMLPNKSRHGLLFYNPALEQYWKQIDEEFNPDIINIHGTEYSHGLACMRALPDKKYLVTIQGIISEIVKYRNGTLNLFQLLKYRNKYENKHHNGMIEKTLIMKFNSRYEKGIIKRASYATGRTDWDRDFILKINPNIKYFRCNYNLRPEFYEAKKWDVKTMQRNSIYFSTASYSPLKGGDIALKALGVLKDKKIPFTAHFVGAGENGKSGKNSGFTNYFNSLIDKFDLQDSLFFHRFLDTDGVIKMMQSVNAVVVPSSMENASATLREALSIGTPCISSKRGGMVQLSNGGTTVLQYEYEDYKTLASLLEKVFNDDEFDMQMSKREIAYSDTIHNRKLNVENYYKMYKEIFNS